MYPMCVGDLSELGWNVTKDDMTVVVGDMAVRSFIGKYGFKPRVTIVDGRAEGKVCSLTNEPDVTVFNASYELTYGLNEEVFKALNRTERTLIKVIGEEDNAQYAVKLHAQDGVKLFYGNPENNTICAVICGPVTRFEAAEKLFRKRIA